LGRKTVPEEIEWLILQSRGTREENARLRAEVVAEQARLRLLMSLVSQAVGGFEIPPPTKR
jgi:hypothetical protein